jgi:ceramide glucosyltransferase
MNWSAAGYALLVLAAIPFIYYLIALYSASRYFRQADSEVWSDHKFTPPLSLLKPIHGLDPEAYENFASFCRQDYEGDYEILFCVDGHHDPSVPILERLMRDFPRRAIRILYGSGRNATNDKVAKLARLLNEAQSEIVVISDSDVRVRPDYLRTVVAPLADPRQGAVTCFYVPTRDTNLVQSLQSIGMVSDFYAGILVARQLDGVKFALGPTIAASRTRIAGFGGFEALENRPADDLLVGRLIAEQGYDVKLLSYPVETVPDYHSMRSLYHKRLRWIVVMRHMRPWGHLGLIFTHGLPWSLLAVAAHPTAAVAAAYLGGYLALRSAIVWIIGIRGLKQRVRWSKLPLIPLWDAMAFLIWLVSFTRSTLRWRDGEYAIREGRLVPLEPAASAPEPEPEPTPEA